MGKSGVLYLLRQESLVAPETVTVEQLAGMEVILGEGRLIVFHVVFNPIAQRWQLVPEDHLSIDKSLFSMYGLTLAVYEHEGSVFCAVRHIGRDTSLKRLDLSDVKGPQVQEMSVGDVTSSDLLSIEVSSTEDSTSTALIPAYYEKDGKVGAILYSSSLE